MVGYELTPWDDAVLLLLGDSASTLATRTLDSAAKSLASSSHVGASVLQSKAC